MRTLLLDWLREILTPLWRFTEALRNPEVQRPGYVGSVPYLALLRLLVYSGAFLRFVFHRDEYTNESLLLLAILFAMCWLIVFFDFKRAWLSHEAHQRWKWRITCLDIVFISVLYYLTRKLESDFFLFYYLPIITSAEYLSAKRLQATGILVTLAFATTLTLMVLAYGSPRPTLQVVFSHFLPREVFFVIVVIVSSHLRLSDILRSQHSRKLEIILRFRAEADDIIEDNKVIDAAVRTAENGLQTQAGQVWLAPTDKKQSISSIIQPPSVNENLDSTTGGTPNHLALSVPLLVHKAPVGHLCVSAVA